MSTLDDRYFEWLYKYIGNVGARNPARTHWKFARQLYTKEFIWLIPNDDNRAADGRDLRYLFFHEEHIEDPDPIWNSLGCSMMEMLVALSLRLSFETEGEPQAWFWELMENIDIGMQWSSDKNYDEIKAKKIDDALNCVIWRTYAPSGAGGLFPLPVAKEDQRVVEIWYQLSAYLVADL